MGQLRTKHHTLIKILGIVTVIADGTSFALAQTHTTTPAVIAKVVGVIASLLSKKLLPE